MRAVVPIFAICLVIVNGSVARAEPAAPSGTESTLSEYAIKGTVVSVQPGEATIIIRQANLLGDLLFVTKAYRVKRPSSLTGLKRGDRVRGVYSTKDKMLHRLRESPRWNGRKAQGKDVQSKAL